MNLFITKMDDYSKTISLVSFFLWHINLHGIFDAKTILIEEKEWSYLTNSWGYKGVHSFHKDINQKVSVIAWLEFEHTYSETAVQHFNNYTKGTPPYSRSVGAVSNLMSVC